MYRHKIAELALQGAARHGSIGEYLGDYRASKGVFEMYVADRLTRTRGARFWRFDDLDPAALKAMGFFPRELDADGEEIDGVGVDVTDCTTCIVHCERGALLGLTCATIRAVAIGFHDDQDGRAYIKWPDVFLARNSCAKLCSSLTRLCRNQAPLFDMPIAMTDFHEYVVECVRLRVLVLREAYTVLRCRLPRDLADTVLAFA